MKKTIKFACGVFLITVFGTPSWAQIFSSKTADLRVLSWNISELAFVKNSAEFQTLIQYSEADFLLLDEVAPAASESLLREVLPSPESEENQNWFIDYGHSGGRQRGVIASRYPLETVPEFDSKISYPNEAQAYIDANMSEKEKTYVNWSTDGGIAANAAIAIVNERRILLVTLDLQCCGNDPASWQEYRRRAEAREIRRRIRQVLDRTSVDAIIVAGDFNSVATPLPQIIAGNVDHRQFSALATAEVYQIDGLSTWTWDGRGTQWPSRIMDIQMYSAQSLKVNSGLVFNSELLSPADLDTLKFQTTTSKQFSDHLPIIIDYQWR